MKNIHVTQPYMPPLSEFQPYLENIWLTRHLTNGGIYHQELERELARYLGVQYISLFANGTLALVTALQALRITGEVITTPYSFVATAHSLLWNGIKPVFVDICPDTFNLDPDKIESAITPQTTAILPVHVYGHPCDVEKIQAISDLYGLKVAYDAAHAFGINLRDASVLVHGDVSILSFHATKVFTTFEGGAIVCQDPKTKERIDYLKNFGFANETTVVAPGINGKMNEVQAAFGLLQLKHIDGVIARRQEIDAEYRQYLSSESGITCPKRPVDANENYSYFPILVENYYKLSRDELYEKLRDSGIYGRRYFYPLISEFPMYRGLSSAAQDNLPVAHSISRKIICLPIHPNMDQDSVHRIVDIIKG